MPVAELMENAYISSATKCVCMLKRTGSSMCYVFIVNTDVFNEEGLYGLIQRNTDYLNSSLSELYANNIYAVYVLAGSGNYGFVERLIETAEVFDGQSVYNIFWGVLLSDKEQNILQNKNQPTDFNNIRKAIENSKALLFVSENNNQASGHLLTLAKEALNESPYKIKTERPFVIYILMVVNIAVFLAMQLITGPRGENYIIEAGALDPGAVVYYGEYYRLVSAIFIHGNAAHLISNCLGMYIFGIRTERHFGSAVMFIIYVLSGILGSIFSLTLTRMVSVGASGAVYGLMGAVLVRSYKSKRAVDGLSAYIIAIFLAGGFVMAFLIPNIDSFGHIGGLIGGLLLGLIYSRTR